MGKKSFIISPHNGAEAMLSSYAAATQEVEEKEQPAEQAASDLPEASDNAKSGTTEQEIRPATKNSSNAADVPDCPNTADMPARFTVVMPTSMLEAMETKIYFSKTKGRKKLRSKSDAIRHAMSYYLYGDEVVCPNCGVEFLVKRTDGSISSPSFEEAWKCPGCGTELKN